MTTSDELRVADLALGYCERDIITNLDLQIAPGKISVIVGANACGKSTLLKSMSRLIIPREGKVIVDGKEVHRTPAKELAPTLGAIAAIADCAERNYRCGLGGTRTKSSPNHVSPLE